MPALQVLTIEDDPAIRRGIVDALRFAGYRPLEADRGDRGLDLARSCQLDLLLLDLLLPGREGMEILREVRQVRPTLPIIILTAKGDEADRVRGLREGADDYVVKPFSVKELLARIEAVLRRSSERPLDVSYLQIAGGRVDLARREVQFDDGGRERYLRARGRVASLPGYPCRPGDRPRRDPGQCLADQSQGPFHADDRYARRPPAGETPRQYRSTRRSSSRCGEKGICWDCMGTLFPISAGDWR